jgi:hypothetical protein
MSSAITVAINIFYLFIYLFKQKGPHLSSSWHPFHVLGEDMMIDVLLFRLGLLRTARPSAAQDNSEHRIIMPACRTVATVPHLLTAPKVH